MTANQIDCPHMLQGDEEEEVEEPGTVDVEPREDKKEREVDELVKPEEEVGLMKGLEHVEEGLKL